MPRGRLSVMKHLGRAQVTQEIRGEVESGLGDLQDDLAASGSVQGQPKRSIEQIFSDKGYTPEQIQEFLNRPSLGK